MSNLNAKPENRFYLSFFSRSGNRFFFFFSDEASVRVFYQIQFFPQTMQTTQNHFNWVTFTSMCFFFGSHSIREYFSFLHFQSNFSGRNESVSCSLIRLRLGELNFISIKYKMCRMNLFRSRQNETFFICFTSTFYKWKKIKLNQPQFL